MHLKIWPWSVSQVILGSISFWMDTSIYKHYMVFCRQKIPNKDLSRSKSKIVYTRLYLNKVENIMRALSDALPTGHRAMANPTLQLHFGCGRATPSVSHSHNLAIREDAKFFVQNWTKKLFLPIKTQKLIWRLNDTTEAYIVVQLQWFLLNGQFEGNIIFCHLKRYIRMWYAIKRTCTRTGLFV